MLSRISEDLQRLEPAGEQTDTEPLSSFKLEYEGEMEEEDEEEMEEEVEEEKAPFGDEPIIQIEKDRQAIYENNYKLFLTHLIRPSDKPNQKYDIFIYLIRHGDQSFEDVKFADFFFGPWWKNKVFRRREVNGRIGLSTAAHGTFLCTCHVQMKDGNRIFLYRYIDFEMGSVFEKKA